MSQDQFAELLQITQGHLSAIETGRRNISRSIISLLAEKIPELNIEYLISGRGEIWKEKRPASVHLMSPNLSHLMADIPPKMSPNKVNTKEFSIAEEQPAPIYQVEKKEGEKDWKLLLPGIPGRLRTFSIYGTSMHPALRDGDVIICAKCDFTDIEDGKVYAVVDTSLTINVKYAYPYPDGLLLVPANREEYRPIIIEKKNILEVWKALLLLTSEIHPFGEIGATQDLEKKIAHLEAFVRKLFPDYGELEGD